MNFWEEKNELKPSSRKYSYEPNTDRLTRSSLDALLEAVSHNDLLLRKLNEDRLAIVNSSDMVEADGEFDCPSKQRPGSSEKVG